jgi:hypothetical protein
MSANPIFPALTNWEPTRQSLHWYIRAVGIVPRAHAEFREKWWHVSLKVLPDGLVTDKMDLPDSGGQFRLKVDLREHKVVLFVNKVAEREFSMTEGLTSTQFGDRLLEAVSELGLTAGYAREKFENDEPREYDPAAAGRYLTALVNADRVFKDHRDSLSGEKGPVQLWPHGFDLSFEWFGTRVEMYEEHGKVQEYPAQLNLGFDPGAPDTPPYFYSNPWPFESGVLLDSPLPAGARWHTEGWEGTILPYEELAGDASAEQRLREYARRVYELCAPTLMAAAA